MPAMRSTSSPRAYRRSEIEVFDLIERPIWVCLCGEEWGDQKRLVWGNSACVSLWNGSSLQDIQSRDFNVDMSDAVKQRYHDIARRCKTGERFSQQWTYYPGGVATTMVVTFSEIWIDEEDGNPPLPAVLADVLNTQEISAQTKAEGLRSIEMLRHLPVAVALFGGDGSLVLQNPIDTKLFQGDEVNEENDERFATSESSLSTSNNSVVDGNPHAACSFVKRFVDAELGRQILTDVVETGAVYNIDAEQITGPNTRAWFALQVQRSTDPVNGSMVLLYSARDITHIIRAKQQEQATAIKSEFLSCVAHEIRTPFHQVNGFNELLGKTNLNSLQREYVQEIDAASKCMMSVLNDLLDFNKLEAGKIQIEAIQFNPQDVIRGSLSALQPQAEKKHLLLINESLEHAMPLNLIGDPNRLRQILLNFLSNGIKFTSKGTITLNVTVLEDGCVQNGDDDILYVEFSVLDSGIGISKENQAAIFQKYVQAEAGIARQFGGTGLGLAICQGLAEAMGGEIGVDSTLGQGSRFWVRLPFQRRSSSTAEVHVDNTESTFSVGSCFNILVVEDNRMNQKLVKSMLERLGHTASLADDGIQALGAIEKENFDLVLMDLHMPNMDGIEATKHIRGRMGLSVTDLPVLGLSADFRPDELDHYLRSGMNSCIGKPVRMKVLEESISRVIAKSRTGG